MRSISVIAFAIYTLTLVPPVAAQSKAAGDSSSKISTAAPADFPDEEAFAAYQRVTKDIKPPKAKSSPDPAYPELPPYTEPNGIVEMLVGIDTKGHVELVHVLRGSNAAFESSAVATVKKWRFSPAKKDGKAVPVQITVEMRFQK
jgi:TonB family protein